MITDSAAVFMFAVRSAIKLSRQSRIAYVDSTRRRALVLPLPNFANETDELEAVQFFRNGSGKKFVDGYERDGEEVESDAALKAAVKKFKRNQPDPELNRQLVDFYTKYRFVLRMESGDTGSDSQTSAGDAFALLTVQQWRRGYDPTPSTLHRIGGTLIEIGIEYANTAPELFDEKTAKGKALKGFLNGLNNTDFKEGDLSELPARLFVATVETINSHPDLVSGDARIQELVSVTTQGISSNVKARLDTINADASLDVIEKRQARFDAQDWGAMIFRTTLSTGGRMVLDDPGKFLGITVAGHQSLVTSVGGSVLDLVLDDTVGLRGILSREGLETITKSALGAVGRHPEILAKTDNEGIRKLISTLATDLSTTNDLLSKDILPELVRMTLENTGQNLELFWPDLKNHPEKNLILTAAKSTLAILSTPPKNSDKWKLTFSKEDLLTVTGTVLDEFLEDPQWLLDDAGDVSEVWHDVLSSTINVLRKRANNRLNIGVAIEIVQAALHAAALRQEFVVKMPNGKPMVAAAIDAILSVVFDASIDKKATWQLLRSEVLVGVNIAALRALSNTKLDPQIVGVLKTVLQAQVDSLANGQLMDLESFENSLEDALPVAQ